MPSIRSLLSKTSHSSTAGPAGTTAYTIRGGDTFSHVASLFKVDVNLILALNPGVDPTKLQIGQSIQVPLHAANEPQAEHSRATEYVVQAGDTFTSIANKHGCTLSKIQGLNAGINANNLQIGQYLKVPSRSAQPSAYSKLSRSNGIGSPLVQYSGPASSFPPLSDWAPYHVLWTHNSGLMRYSNSPSEITILGHAIPQIANETSIDPRVILCMCMQETGGNVRAKTTLSPAPDFIRNTGIMQAHDGASYNVKNPEESIWQMIRDGAGGTRSGDGLKQCLRKRHGNYYEALRMYNSGSVDRGELSNGITATGHYVSMMANRLCGHIWEGM